jgi:hypothetical protein
MKNLLIVLLSASLLGACQLSSTVRESASGNAFQQLEGARLVLNEPIRVSAGQARVFVQDGGVRPGFNSFKPHCAFEIKSVRHDGVVIEPDTFFVSRVQRSVQEVVSAEPLRVAALWLADGIGGGGGSASYYSGYHFWLRSEVQPEVLRMSCFGVFAQPYELHPPTVEEIRFALGTVATLE